MKKLLLLLILFFHLLLELHAQMVYIPDSAFRQKLIILGMSACLTGDSIDPACFQVQNRNTLDVSNASIHNLQGIQVFTNLSSLKCNYNPGLTIPALP